MAPEENTSSTEDISDDEQQDQQQDTTPDTGGNGDQQQVADKNTKLPDDHPLVKQLAADKAKLSKANSELTELRAKSAQVTKLEEELGKRPTTEAVETLQTRYDRLEAFLQAAGGPISKALDSRTFTRALFETDEDITAIVKAWQKANPTATSAALGSAAGGDGKAKQDPNALIRAAFNGSKN